MQIRSTTAGTHIEKVFAPPKNIEVQQAFAKEYNAIGFKPCILQRSTLQRMYETQLAACVCSVYVHILVCMVNKLFVERYGIELKSEFNIVYCLYTYSGSLAQANHHKSYAEKGVDMWMWSR